VDQLDLLVSNACVLTMDPERRVLARGYVGIRGEHIVMVGTGGPPAETVAARTIDAGGALCHPGLIDAHAHVAWGLARSAVPEHFSEEEVFRLFDERMLALVRDEDEHLGTMLACVEMALNGTTCFGDTGSASRDLAPTAEAVERIGIRGMISMLNGDAADGIPALNRPLDDCLERAAAGVARYPRTEGLAWACVGLVGMETASDALVREAKGLADEAGVPLNVHKSFSADEVLACRSRLGGRDPLQGYEGLGVLDTNLTLVHVNHCSSLEADLLVEGGSAVVHCPTASMMYGIGGSRTGRFPELLDRRLPVALGTDSTHWCNAWDLTRSMYLAATLHKEATGQRLSVTAETALEMATIHGAQAVGRADELGSIEPGKRADIVVHDATRPEAHPAVDPVANLLFSNQSRTVGTVIVNGEIVVEDARPTRVDLERLLSDVDERARELYGWLGYEPASRWPVETSA
jgi:5-methylthioadenosine/S-adenosylhomocysteine deaminase